MGLESRVGRDQAGLLGGVLSLSTVAVRVGGIGAHVLEETGGQDTQLMTIHHMTVGQPPVLPAVVIGHVRSLLLKPVTAKTIVEVIPVCPGGRGWFLGRVLGGDRGRGTHAVFAQ